MGRIPVTRVVAVLALSGLHAPSAARDLPSPIYEAQYGWEQERTRDSCAVRREFGAGSDVILLEFRQYFPSSALRTTVAASELKNKRERARPVEPKARLYPGELEIEPRAYFRIVSKDGPNGLLFTLSTERESTDAEAEIERDPYEGLRKFDTLILEDVFTRDIGIALGPMGEVLDFMGDCTEGLVAGWGLDPEAQKKRKQAPKIVNLPQAGRQIAQTYPIGPLKRSQNGRVNLRLLVDAAGNASDCFVEPPVLPEFRETACQETLKYARFEPALDADGQPIASYYVTSIVYWLNETPGN